jgi:integrase
MLALCPDNMIGKRDRALLALGFAGAFRRSELVALEVADLTETPDGLRVTIRRSKGDQEGQGRRSPYRAATACARSRRCRHGLPRQTSAAGRCSGQWRGAAGSPTRLWRTTQRRGS